MHSYSTLALLALAVSTASPAISAPVQEQARAIVDDRSLSSILKTIGSGAAFGSIPILLEDFLGGNSTRRDLDERGFIGKIFDDLLGAIKTNDPLTKVIGDGIISGVATGGAVLGTTALLNSTSERRDLNERTPISIGSIFDDLLGALKTDDPLKKVIGDGVVSGVATGGAVLGTEQLLNSTRRAFSLSNLGGIEKTAAGLLTSFLAAQGVESIFGGNNTKRELQAPPSKPTASDLLIALSLLSRQLEELD